MSRDQNALQLAYYQQTAGSYDEMHVAAGDEHSVALEYVIGICETVQAASLLDVGSGTGRAVRFLLSRRPALKVVGVEPSQGLRDQAQVSGIGEYVDGVGERLPFPDNSFDVVLATAVMHHVPDADPVLREMIRVARKAVIISDANRFGQAGVSSGLVKLALRRLHLWSAYTRLKTRGKGYMYSEGDGVFYSYSVYDSIPALATWATRTYIVPTKISGPIGRAPLLNASQALLVGIREPCFEGWAGVEALGSDPQVPTDA